MIKVVGVDESFKSRTACNQCGSILEYFPADRKKRINTDISGTKDINHHIVCPICENEVNVN